MLDVKKIAIVFGTRPEAIKMAPVIREINNSKEFSSCIIVSAQHREMLDQVLNVFKIVPDYDLNIMKKEQSLADITADVLKGIEEIFIKEQPDLVLVHGDTTTSLSAALAAYYHQIPIGHVEAGLRTHDKNSPFPEEGNRVLIDSISDLFFVPTKETHENLTNEGKDPSSIVVTGNTVIDVIGYTNQMLVNHPALELMEKNKYRNWILLTAHRRENLGSSMINIFKSIVEIIDKFPNVEVLVPLHLSPKVREAASLILEGVDRVHLIDPLEVDAFHKVIARSYLVLTDSGGLQEEAPSFDKPVLVLRDKTERPEGVTAGTLKVIGTEKDDIVQEVSTLLSNEKEYIKMAEAVNPYGDGKASKRILESVREFLLM
jgi:UDP-N-acetylglucosamine 2-epimerase (non-hydrolysing)